jgi:hypothetical protein
MTRGLFVFAVTLSMSAPMVYADLIGTTVTGQMVFDGSSTNKFDPSEAGSGVTAVAELAMS